MLNKALDLNFKRRSSDATFLYLFNQSNLQQFGEVLQAWMISEISDGATTLEQLVCEGKTQKFRDRDRGRQPPCRRSGDHLHPSHWYLLGSEELRHA